MIPWKLFHVLYTDTEHLWAMDKLQLAQGATTALSVAFAGEEDRPKVRRQLDELIETALPTTPPS